MKEMNVRYQNQGNYHLPCITVKEQNELHIGVWANRHRQYLKLGKRSDIKEHTISFPGILSRERSRYVYSEFRKHSRDGWPIHKTMI